MLCCTTIVAVAAVTTIHFWLQTAAVCHWLKAQAGCNQVCMHQTRVHSLACCEASLQSGFDRGHSSSLQGTQSSHSRLERRQPGQCLDSSSHQVRHNSGLRLPELWLQSSCNNSHLLAGALLHGEIVIMYGTATCSLAIA